MEAAVQNMQKNMDGFAAKCFQIGAKKYFEVETDFVLKKLAFISLPFVQLGKGKSGQADDVFEEDANGGQGDQAAGGEPREATDTDLYVPLMAFISYTILSCLYLGISAKFDPSLIASNFSNCLTLTLIEALCCKMVLWYWVDYNPRYLQILAVASYKYVG